MNNIRNRLKRLKRTNSNVSSFGSNSNNNINFINVYGININKGDKFFVVESGNRFSVHTMRGLLNKMGVSLKNNKNVIHFFTNTSGKNPNAVLFKPLNKRKRAYTYKNFKLTSRG